VESRNIKGVEHYIFDNDSEFIEFFENNPPPIAENWRTALKGEWVRSDDDRIIQIVGRSRLKHHNDRDNYSWANGYVRTAVGTFVCHKSVKMDTDFTKHYNRYRFGINYKVSGNPLAHRKKITNKERAFANYIAAGVGLEKSYREAYDYSGIHVKQKAFLLLKQERIVAEVSKSISDIATALGVDHEYIIKKLKAFSDYAKDENVGLRAVTELGKIVGTVGNQPKLLQTGIVGVFSGFDEKHFKRIDGPNSMEVAGGVTMEVAGEVTMEAEIVDDDNAGGSE